MTEPVVSAAAAPAVAAPPSLLTGLKRGLTRRCPNCGEGALFRGYLKVEPTCPRCGNDNGQYPADDGPAYFTILIIGHLVIAPGLMLTVIEHLSPFLLCAIGLPLVGGLTLTALPFIKGGWIGVLWASGRH